MEDFLKQLATTNLTCEEALEKLDCVFYLKRKKLSQVVSAQDIAQLMIEDGILLKQGKGLFAISNLGALTYAKDLNFFSRLWTKALRIVKYQGNSRFQILEDKTFSQGYACHFEESLKLIEDLTLNKSAYPHPLITELLANTLLRQDFSLSGSYPLVEIFDKRIEFTNPYKPFLSYKQFFLNESQSYNEQSVKLFNLILGRNKQDKGWNTILALCEKFKLPFPRINLYESNLKITVFSSLAFKELDQNEQLRACYLHCQQMSLKDERMSYQSLKERFNLPYSQKKNLLKLIAFAEEKGIIKAEDQNLVLQERQYLPVLKGHIDLF